MWALCVRDDLAISHGARNQKRGSRVILGDPVVLGIASGQLFAWHKCLMSSSIAPAWTGMRFFKSGWQSGCDFLRSSYSFSIFLSLDIIDFKMHIAIRKKKKNPTNYETMSMVRFQRC